MSESCALPRREKRRENANSCKRSRPSVLTPKYKYIVVGGGIAGVSCVQELAQIHYNDRILLISASEILKEAKTILRATKYVEEVVVYEKSCDALKVDRPNVDVICDQISCIDIPGKTLHLSKGETMPYHTLCICTGGQPKVLLDHPNVISIRDVESVRELQRRLEGAQARHVAVIGNGGIALELVNLLTFCDVSWIVKDEYIGNTFFDASASAFVMPTLQTRVSSMDDDSNDIGSESVISVAPTASCAPRLAVPSSPVKSRPSGQALGPEWITSTGVRQHLKEVSESDMSRLCVSYGQEVRAMRTRGDTKWTFITPDDCLNEAELADVQKRLSRVISRRCTENDGSEYELYILTTQNKVIGCDFAVSAIGVQPDTSFFDSKSIVLEEDGSIAVNHFMATSARNIFAAGDCCHIRLPKDEAVPHWFQMRLWSQAKLQGKYAACTMSRRYDNIDGSIFGLFTHMTHFFGHKVILLGRYNAQGLGDDVERYVKNMVVTQDGLVVASAAKDVAQGKNVKDVSYSIQAYEDLTEKYEVEVWLRVTAGEEYAKVVVHRGRVIGAMLIGDTDLEEVFENLILNELDISSLGVDILNPNIDLEDYFD